MSSRWGSSGSRWSSERERAEREQRERERAAADKGGTPTRRSWREGRSGSPATPSSGTSGGRPAEHSSTETPASRWVGGEGGTGRANRRGEAAASTTSTGKPSPVGRKWRSSAPPPPDEGPALPNLPGDEKDRKGGGTSSRILIFGAVLFALMAVIAFLPFSPLGGGDDAEPTNTPPVAVVPTAPSQDPSNPRGAGTPETPTRPADSEMVVCVDPGHGGWDPGRERQRDGNFVPPYFNESEINLAMGLMFKQQLEARGVTVIMTRETGTAVNVFGEDINGDGRTLEDSQQDGERDELQARINVCNDGNADILLSLHLNGFDDASVRGYEVLYTPYPTREFGQLNLDLGNAIYRALGAAYDDAGFETDARGVKSDQADLVAELHEFGSENNLVLTGPAVTNPDYTIVPSSMPGVFVEPVFITNQDDANFIVREENQRLLAEAYAEGVMRYFDRHPG